ncbi:TetR family transcriptional regulator [Acuticoccus sediminis]|uniref:TetR family transcriptional regulator n=1 Tax=Acuticoccus sediminis TaxID=2184697 RepID=A0A8B2NUC4_9HYPH|nr:TetR/AcrR family transcriptional regulator [Acuticoccus sediminis]RAI01878.1 TetR family transcriptional regulator [Acuticoccus sediminis]
MRVSRDVAARNRRTVVETAGRSFREHGYDGVGVAALMKAAGLTHGGFYKQFDSKEALAAEATAAALQENREAWAKILDGVEGDALEAVAARYLTPAHVRTRDRGCAFASLAAEAPRHGPELGKVFGDAVEDWVSAVAAASPDDPPDRCDILRTLSMLVGALILSRAVPDGELRAEILACAKTGARSPRDGDGPDR